MTSPYENALAGSSSADGVPQPGELKIKERRSWRTWQLLTAVLVAAVFGMWLNGDTGGGAASTTGTSSGSGHLPPPSAASSGSASGGSTTTTAARGIDHHHHCSRWIDHDHGRRRIDDDVDDHLGCRGGTGARPPDLAADAGQLDEHVVHDNRRTLEHRLGVPLRSRPRLGTLVRGVRHPGRVGAHRHARDQRDRAVRAIGHGTVQHRRADARGASPGVLRLDRQGDGFVEPPGEPCRGQSATH